MAHVVNLTPFSVSSFGVLDSHAQQFDVLVLSARFEAPPEGNTMLADLQSPVREQDMYNGEPGLSSVRYEGESATEKQFVDVVINGRAYAPSGKSVKQVTVGLRIADINKQLLVVGDRFRSKGLSSPMPFTSMPILYERAFGGTTSRGCYSWNPIGIGYKGARSKQPKIETELPNILHGGSNLKSQEPAGFGVLARSWRSRICFAGTYDEVWQKEQYPLLPLDFDPRFYQIAPTDQQSKIIHGGELVEIRNMTPEGLWRFKLPHLDVPVRLLYPNYGDIAALRLDTVMIEPAGYRVTMIARAKIPVVRKLGPLMEIVVGHVSGAWWRARLQGKRFIDILGTDGRIVGAQSFIV